MQHVQLKDTPTECATELKTSQMQLRDKVLCDLFFSFCIILLGFCIILLGFCVFFPFSQQQKLEG